MKIKWEKGGIGQRFDDFLREQGRYEESKNQAVKRVIAHQLAAAMETQQLTKSAFARKLKTSRSQLDRLLDPENTKVTLEVLSRPAHAVGRELQLGLRSRPILAPVSFSITNVDLVLMPSCFAAERPR